MEANLMVSNIHLHLLRHTNRFKKKKMMTKRKRKKEMKKQKKTMYFKYTSYLDIT